MLQKIRSLSWCLVLTMGILLSSFFASVHFLAAHQLTHAASTRTSPLMHFTGGFSLDTPARVANAAQDGIQNAVYGFDTPSDPVGAALQRYTMHEISRVLWDDLQHYECQKEHTCSSSLTTVSALLSKVSSDLQQAKNDPLIVGYWVLDDWPLNDSGSARSILIQVNALIHQITPGRPSICGFGSGGLFPLPSAHSGWSNSSAANFSPQGCDMVDLYVYAESGTSGTYDWTMSSFSKAAFAGLKQYGWNPAATPLVGTPQAFGGLVGGELWPMPSARSVETQTKAFCQQGAIGILYYAWDNSDTDASSRFPWNSTAITQGIRAGLADCRSIWGSAPASSPAPLPPVLAAVAISTSAPVPTETSTTIDTEAALIPHTPVPTDTVTPASAIPGFLVSITAALWLRRRQRRKAGRRKQALAAKHFCWR